MRSIPIFNAIHSLAPQRHSIYLQSMSIYSVGRLYNHVKDYPSLNILYCMYSTEYNTSRRHNAKWSITKTLMKGWGMMDSVGGSPNWNGWVFSIREESEHTVHTEYSMRSLLWWGAGEVTWTWTVRWKRGPRKKGRVPTLASFLCSCSCSCSFLLPTYSLLGCQPTPTKVIES